MGWLYIEDTLYVFDFPWTEAKRSMIYNTFDKIILSF